MQTFEISGYQTGISREGVNFLQPADAFQNLKNGYVYRQQLQSRKGFQQFATGGLGGKGLLSSRGKIAVAADGVGNSTNTAAQTFTLSNTQVERDTVVISLTDSVLGAKSITITAGDYDGDEAYTGNVNLGGTNTINWNTGAITVTFDAVLTGGDAISVAYDYYPGLRVMGIFEHFQPANTTEMLVCDTKYFYKFDPSTNTLPQVTFNSAAAITDFGISNNEDYVSGTTYPTASGGERFVFTGKGMSDIFFYDGTNVLRFTNGTDNTNYQAPAAGALTKAFHVFWFGERLVLLAPTINAVFYPQGILYSAIRNSSGNGDKFNTAGSGLLQADTNEWITAARILGNELIIFFTRSVWRLRKTTDAFNPFIIEKIPSVLGTDAPFSMAGWDDEIEVLGRTGIVSTDSRKADRVDNKIPFFTRDDVDPNDIQLTYGGFNRDEANIYFSYRSNESSLADTQDKVLAHNYEERTFSVYDLRFSCFCQSYVGVALAWNQIDENIKASWARWDTTEDIWNKIGIGSERQKTLAGDDLGFIYEIDVDFDDYLVPVYGITQASNAVVNTAYNAFQVGDEVIFEDLGGMTELDFSNYDNISTITAVASTGQFTVDTDTSTFTAFTNGGVVSKVINFEAETIPFNPWREEGKRCFISHIDFLLDANGGFLRVDIFENGDETPWKENVLVQPSNPSRQNREWVRIQINNTADFHVIKVKQKTAKVQMRHQSMRIYARPDGETYG